MFHNLIWNLKLEFLHNNPTVHQESQSSYNQNVYVKVMARHYKLFLFHEIDPYTIALNMLIYY